MKIMFFYSSMMAGGAERMISALANCYAKQEIEVSIAVINNNFSFYPLNPQVSLLKIGDSKNSQNLYQAIKNNLEIILSTRQALKEVKPDCVICFGINYVVYSLVAKIFLNIKVIGSERSNPYSSPKGFWDNIKKFVSPLADGYIFQTNGAKRYYPRSVQKKCEVIQNGILIDSLPADIVPLNERIQNSICAVGRLAAVKDFDKLIFAFAQFLKMHPSYTLTIYGEGEDRGKLEELINNLHLYEKVFLAGRISNILEEVSKREIFILSSRYEGMPNALIEGLACGCGCIATDCDFGPSELIQDGKNGLLVPVGDIDAMTSAMQKLASNRPLLEKIAKNALNIRNTHSMEKIAKRYLDYIIRTVGR